jgi:hypothetical protein
MVCHNPGGQLTRGWRTSTFLRDASLKPQTINNRRDILKQESHTVSIFGVVSRSGSNEDEHKGYGVRSGDMHFSPRRTKECGVQGLRDCEKPNCQRSESRKQEGHLHAQCDHHQDFFQLFANRWACRSGVRRMAVACAVVGEWVLARSRTTEALTLRHAAAVR